MGVDEAVAAPVTGRGPDRFKAFILIMGAVSLLSVLQVNLLTTFAINREIKACRTSERAATWYRDVA